MERPTPFSRCVVAALACGCAAAWVSANGQSDEPGPRGNPDAEWLERTRELLERAEESPAPDWLNLDISPEALAQAEAIAEMSRARAAGVEHGIGGGATAGAPDRVVEPGEETVLVFASFSMPEITLRNLLDQASEPHVVLVLRGLVEGIDIRNTQARVEALIDASGGRVPNVLIDPTLYRRYGVKVAPTLVLERRTPGGEEIPVRVTGAVTVDWLRRQAGRVSATEAVDLGRRAEIHEIAEPDLILEMQRRLAEVNWAAQRQEAIDGFWRSGHNFLDLPDAPEDTQFAVDPTVRITENITDENGRVLVAAGERYNPLDILPMTKTVVVFRGTDARHRAKAAEIAAEVRKEGRGVILLTTVVDTAAGWDSLSEMETAVQGPVYLLMPNVAERFHLRHAPATVSAQGRRLVVKEWALPAFGAGRE